MKRRENLCASFSIDHFRQSGYNDSVLQILHTDREVPGCPYGMDPLWEMENDR
jgi:hypothetical protein